MKVQDPKGSAAVRDPQPAEKRAPRSTSVEPDARVTTGGVAEFRAAVEAAKRHAALSRTTKLQNLESAIRSGGYQPNPQLIADRILEAAVLNAQLRAMLVKND